MSTEAASAKTPNVQLLSDAASGLSQIDTRTSDSLEIIASEIAFENKIGQGQFGIVYQALWKGKVVAVKDVIGGLQSNQTSEFIAEANLMRVMTPHENVIQLIGVCLNPVYIITQYCANGSLLNYMKQNVLSSPQIKKIITDISCGMSHLHSQQIIHRDLAARNVLLTESLTAVVSDFGCARVLRGSEESGKTLSTTGPIRWMSPESLKEKVYSFKSDVYSFGVTIFECVSAGQLPWSSLDLADVIISVTSGKTIELSHGVPTSTDSILKELMCECMSFNSKDRPTFQQIITKLQHNPNPEYANIQFAELGMNKNNF